MFASDFYLACKFFIKMVLLLIAFIKSKRIKCIHVAPISGWFSGITRRKNSRVFSFIARASWPPKTRRQYFKPASNNTTASACRPCSDNIAANLPFHSIASLSSPAAALAAVCPRSRSSIHPSITPNTMRLSFANPTLRRMPSWMLDGRHRPQTRARIVGPFGHRDATAAVSPERCAAPREQTEEIDGTHRTCRS